MDCRFDNMGVWEVDSVVIWWIAGLFPGNPDPNYITMIQSSGS